MALLAAVLFLPGLRTLFLAVPLTGAQLAQVAGLAFAPTALIQLLKSLRVFLCSRGRKTADCNK